MDKTIAWLATEIIQHFMFHALFYGASLLFAGSCFVLGVLIFGRKYKQRIADLERRFNEREADLEQRFDEREQANQKNQEKKERKRILRDFNFLIDLESGRLNWHETANRIHQEAIVDEFREIGLFESRLPDHDGLVRIRAMIERFGLPEAIRKIKGERA